MKRFSCKFHKFNRKHLCQSLLFNKVAGLEGFLKLPNLHMLIKLESITSQKLGSRDFWRVANSVLNKGKSAILPIFNGPEVLSSASDKAKLFPSGLQLY